jgi:acyl-CoA synthetase (AMP-forming)/AMP-acid ligase II
MITIGELLYNNALKFPNKTALADLDRRYTFGQFNGRVNRLANALIALRLKIGDKVAVYARNSIEYMEIFHAAAKIGVGLVTLNFWLRMREVAVLYNHSDATCFIIDEPYQESFAKNRDQFNRLMDNRVIVIGRADSPSWHAYQKLVEAYPDHEPGVTVASRDAYWMMYTSGTTGNPKGVIRSHERTNLCSWYAALEFGFNQDDYFLAVSPFFHGVTFFALMVLQLGGSVFVLREFDPDRVLKIIEQEGITSTFMVPTMLDMVLASPVLSERNPSRMRVLVTGAAPLPSLVKKRIMEAFGPVLYEFYGATESGYMTVLHPRDQERKNRCCGQPCFGALMQVRDAEGNPLGPGQVGELFSKCAGRFDGYYKDPQRTREALQGEWFTAGDLGMKDEENFYYIVDRKTDMIISGGENIYPREIEDVLRFMPEIEDCAVIGVADPLWGEAVKAFLVVKKDHQLSAKKVQEHCMDHLAGFKKPKFVEFITELPRTASGKVMKNVLRGKEIRPVTKEEG